MDKKEVTREDARGVQDGGHARSHPPRQRHPARSRIRPARRHGQRAKNAGLLLAYENSGYDNTRPGRLPDLLDIWSVRRLVAAGADCIKILLYYTPFDPPDVNDIKHAWVERIGAECAASDVRSFLEFVGYEEGGDEKGIEFASKKPEIVTQSMEEFSKPQYGVDVLKVEVPVNMAFVAGTQGLQGRIRLHARRSQGTFPQGRRGSEEAVHLSFRRRQQRRLYRDARTGRRSRHRIFRASCAAAPPGRKPSRSTPSRA